MNDTVEVRFVFNLNEIVLEYGVNSSVRYCLRKGRLFKCVGGGKDYKRNLFFPKRVSVVKVVDLQLSSDVKKLAVSLGIPVVHNRNLCKFR